MNLNRFYDLFVGNKQNHIVWNDGRWIRADFPITPHLLKEHFSYKKAIGSYPIYKEDNIDYCKWVCIDVDSHMRVPKQMRKQIKKQPNWKFKLLKLENEYKRKIDENKKNAQRQFCLYLAESKLLLVDNILVEDSGGGFHIWILLKDHTTLEDAGKYIQTIKPEVNAYYSLCFPLLKGTELPEFYPKQYTTEHLEESLGNGVRLPNGKNIGKDAHCEMLYGDLETINQNDIKHIADKYNGPDVTTLNGASSKRKEVEYYEPQEVDEKLKFWLYFPRIRPCMKKIITGETQCYSTHGHNMRMALVHECAYFKMPVSLMPYLFRNQYDFDEDYSRLQVKSILKGGSNDRRYSCKKIKELGYCENECEYEKWLKSNKIKSVFVLN